MSVRPATSPHLHPLEKAPDHAPEQTLVSLPAGVGDPQTRYLYEENQRLHRALASSLLTIQDLRQQLLTTPSGPEDKGPDKADVQLQRLLKELLLTLLREDLNRT